MSLDFCNLLPKNILGSNCIGYQEIHQGLIFFSRLWIYTLSDFGKYKTQSKSFEVYGRETVHQS